MADLFQFLADHQKEKVFQFHPLVNTSTLLISREDLGRFFELTGHAVKFIDVPSQE